MFGFTDLIDNNPPLNGFQCIKVFHCSLQHQQLKGIDNPYANCKDMDPTASLRHCCILHPVSSISVYNHYKALAVSTGQLKKALDKLQPLASECRGLQLLDSVHLFLYHSDSIEVIKRKFFWGSWLYWTIPTCTLPLEITKLPTTSIIKVFKTEKFLFGMLSDSSIRNTRSAIWLLQI